MQLQRMAGDCDIRTAAGARAGAVGLIAGEGAAMIQSAIDRAQISVINLADHADCPPDWQDVNCKFRLQLEDAQALLDVYGRLQEAEKRVPITGEHWRAVVELSSYAADGPRLINELTGDYISMRSQSEGSFEAAKQWNAEADQLRAELTEASRQLDITFSTLGSIRSYLTHSKKTSEMCYLWCPACKVESVLSQITPTETQS